jgi:hypothetical protein
MLISHGEGRLFECTPLDLSKEGGQFLLGSQKIPSKLNLSPARLAADLPGFLRCRVAVTVCVCRRPSPGADYTGERAGFVARACWQVK